MSSLQVRGSGGPVASKGSKMEPILTKGPKASKGREVGLVPARLWRPSFLLRNVENTQEGVFCTWTPIHCEYCRPRKTQDGRTD